MTTAIEHDVQLTAWRDLVKAAVDGRPVDADALAEVANVQQLADVRAAFAHDCDAYREWLAAKCTLAAAVRDLQNARLQHEMDAREHRQLSARLSALQAAIRLFNDMATAPADAEQRMRQAETKAPRMFNGSDN